LAFSLATGAGLLAATAALFDRFQTFLGLFTAVAIIVVAALKALYWRAIDAAPAISDMGAATGLGRFGKVRQWELPHTSLNFVQKEMGYAVARRHARKLRHIVLWCFAAALILILMAMVFSYFAVPAALVLLLASVLERWLFFAEAKHVAMVYYGNNAAPGASAA
jgi:DMSO reductase anchor subunit